MKIILLAFLCLSLAAKASPSAAQTKGDVAAVIGCMVQNTCQNTRNQKSDKTNASYQVEFVLGNTHYMLYYVESLGGQGELSLWIRPYNTKSDSLVSTLTDYSADGTVDFGNIGSGDDTRSPERRKTFHVESPIAPDGIGLTFGPYWQGVYNRALRAARGHLL